MEIRDLVQANRRRLWVLAVLPLLAGGMAFVILDSQPRRYQAELTVTVPAGNETVGTNAQYVANFRQVLRSSQLAEAVARETGATEAGVADQLTSSQVAGSNRIRMRMNSNRPGESSRVLEAAARQATEQLEGPERLTAEARVATALAAVSAAEAAYNEKRVARDKLIAGTDQVLPPETYQTKSARLGQLEDELQQALLEGSSPDPIQAAADKRRRTALQAVVDQRRQELTALGEVVKQFQSLTADLDRAEAALTVAQADFREVTRERRREPASVGKPQEAVVGRLAQTARGVGTAVALALLFALCIFFYPELQKAFRPAPPQRYPEPYPQPTRIYLPTGLEPARGLAIASLPAPPGRANAGHAATDAGSEPATDLWVPPGTQARTTLEKPPTEPDGTTGNETGADESSADERSAAEVVAEESIESPSPSAAEPLTPDHSMAVNEVMAEDNAGEGSGTVGAVTEDEGPAGERQSFGGLGAHSRNQSLRSVVEGLAVSERLRRALASATRTSVASEIATDSAEAPSATPEGGDAAPPTEPGASESWSRQVRGEW